MASERSLQLAAQAWCGEKTSGTEMDTDLATAFAEILDKEDERAKVSETRVYAKLAQAEGGVSRLVRKRVEYCDKPGCPYYHVTPLDEVKSLNRLALDEEDGR